MFIKNGSRGQNNQSKKCSRRDRKHVLFWLVLDGFEDEIRASCKSPVMKVVSKSWKLFSGGRKQVNHNLSPTTLGNWILPMKWMNKKQFLSGIFLSAFNNLPKWLLFEDYCLDPWLLTVYFKHFCPQLKSIQCENAVISREFCVRGKPQS